MSRGGKRTGAGAKPLHGEPMRRVNVMLDTATMDKALTIGNGSLSAGLREAVIRWRQLELEPTDQTSEICGEIMMKVEAEYIRGFTSWDSGGGITIDIVELADGRVLGVTDDSVLLYRDMAALENGEVMTDAGAIVLA